jgi:hypothetical protein
MSAQMNCMEVWGGNRGVKQHFQRGVLLLIKANPKEFELLDEMKVSDQETGVHLALSGDEVFIRELNALAVYG